MPLQVEILYNEYNFMAAFAVASLLASVSLISLAIMTFGEWAVTARSARSAEARAPRAVALPTFEVARGQL
jgi:sulfate transport system permease protein